MKIITSFLFFILTTVMISYSPSIKAQSFEMRWKLETNSKILGGPVNDDQNIYVGNEGGDFYSIDLKNGKINWKFETDGKVQAKALLINNIVFFESGNTYYALNKHEGALIWKYDLGKEAEKFTYSGVDYLYILDPYDDKHASAIVYDELIYTGTSHGEVLGFHINSGEVLFKITLSGNVPIRSTPLIQEGRIYIGDWNGVVYCYDIESKLLRWKKRTYRKKPYATFGGIASEFIIHKGKLFFGARNHMLNVLWTEDGQKEWTYTDPNGGWLISDPVVMNDTLYVGGSDNFSMLALDANDGRLLWTCTRKKNIYAKASVTTDWVIYGGGNSYDPKDTGELVILNRKDGNVLDVFQTSSSVFSAPLLIKNKSVIFGSNDGTIYSLSIN